LNQQLINQLQDGNEGSPKVLFTLAGGGYLWEAKQLVSRLKTPVTFLYVTTTDSMVPTFEEIPEGLVSRVSRVTTLSEKSVLIKINHFVKSFIQSYKLLKKEKPKIIICIGSSISVPLCLCGKLLGIKTVFIESLARVDSLSKTGRIIHRLHLADYFYVQWPEISDDNAGILYAGTLI
jgi:UDP-N-acetylglucosamine:LPS N-acetylglucosamine transferase